MSSQTILITNLSTVASPDILESPLAAMCPSPRSPRSLENLGPDRRNGDVDEETNLPATEDLSTSTDVLDSGRHKRALDHGSSPPPVKRLRCDHQGFSSGYQGENRDALGKATTAVAGCLGPIFESSGAGDRDIGGLVSRMVATENPSGKAEQMARFWEMVAERLKVSRAD